jgi:hypothetical protein
VRKRLIFGLTAAAVVVGSLVVLRHEIAGFAIVTAARIATGYDVTIGDQRIGFDGASFSDVRASRNGVPLISLRRLDIRYSLRDLLPGSKRRFGLAGIDLLGAEVTVERFPDGGFNFTPPSPAPQFVATPQRPSVNPVPWRFTVSVKDSSLQLREPSAYDRVARDIKVEDFNGNADVDSAHRTHYSSKAAFHTEPPEPFTIAGTIDAVRGFAMHRARARRFPLRALANYFTDTAAVRILCGHARDLDARLYSLEVEPNVAPSYHANLKVDIDDASMALATLDAPIKSVRGRLQLVDSTVFLRHMHATLTGIKLHLAGGIYDLLGTASGQPQLRLGIYGSGDLASLRHAFAFTRTQPIAGATDLGVLVEGPLVNPTIVASANAPRASYRGVGFDALHAGVVYRDGVVGLLPLRAYYRGTEIDVRGAMTVGKALQSDLAVHIAGSADQMPYLDELLGREPILADAVATGDNTNFNLTGAAASARGVSRVAALFTLHPNGTAAIEPFWLHTQRGSFDGAYLLDRPHATSAFWALASGLRMKAPADAAFPGLGIPAIPPITGRIERVAVAGGGPGTNVLLAGELAAHDTSIAGLGFYRIAAAFGGSLADAQIGLLHASGPWGRFDGNGAFSSQALVAAGTYRGTLEGLQPFLTNAIPAHGPVAGHTAISVASNRIVVQASDLAMPGATLRGIPVSQASLTLAVEPKQLRVYSARALAAGGSVVAAGTFSLANASARCSATARSRTAAGRRPNLGGRQSRRRCSLAELRRRCDVG